MTTRRALLALLVVAALPACQSSKEAATTGAASSGSGSTQTGERPFRITERGTFDEPWAMTFLPGTDLLAITQRGGKLVLRNQTSGSVTEVGGVPQPVVEGQGGLGDIIPGPRFTEDHGIYLSWVEGTRDSKGAVVGHAVLDLTGGHGTVRDLTVIWRQEPKTSGSGHFSHRLAISPDKKYLFVSSGERQKFDPAQDLSVNLGKIVRLNLDGTPAAGNPFADRGSPTNQIWSYGHRNALGLAFDASGNLWESEMGPKGGDEINLILPGRNYGWPKASNGSNYDGSDIPDHKPGDGYEAPKVWWNPSISPGSLMIYSGKSFPQWDGDAFVGALSGEALIRVHLDGTNAAKADQWGLGERIREVEQGPDGSIWLLQDGAGGKLLQLTPV